MARPPHESWDCMLPGPPSRNNGGSADCHPSGLLAFPSSSSVSVVDSRSMQLVSVLPMPPPTGTSSSNTNSAASSSSSSLSPFVTSVRWAPFPLPHDLTNYQHLLLAAGDRQGRIALFDFRLRSVLLWFESGPASKPGIQDLCWVQGRSDWVLASLSGPSLLSIWNASTGRCIWKYDVSPEFFSCIRRDPFDSRHLCAIGLKGFLLSIKVLGDTEDDVVIKEFHIPNDSSELQKLERDASGTAASSPALAVFPLYIVRFSFSPLWKHILFVAFPRELIVFDLQYETSLFAAALPRGCGKFLDVLPDPNNELLYCAHLDGRLSTWRRKEWAQIRPAFLFFFCVDNMLFILSLILLL